MFLIDDYFASKKALHDYFGYKSDWREIPMEDNREYFWYLTGEGSGDEVFFSLTEEELESREGNCYSSEIYTQRFLPKWVYRGADFTMVCGDPHVDGNKFLYIFDNAKERPQ